MKKGQFMTMTLYKISAHIYPKNINCRTKVNHLLCAHNIPAGVIMNINIYPPLFNFLYEKKTKSQRLVYERKPFSLQSQPSCGPAAANLDTKAGPLKAKALTVEDFHPTGMA